jgi:hypothetical protein
MVSAGFETPSLSTKSFHLPQKQLQHKPIAILTCGFHIRFMIGPVCVIHD